MIRFEERIKSKITYNNRYVREEERALLRMILPFNQAMEDLRYTAIEQKNYMVVKLLADNIHPTVFENVIRRYNADDI